MDVVADELPVVDIVDVTVVDGVVSLQSVKLPWRYPLMAVLRYITVRSQASPANAVFRCPPISQDTLPL